MTSWRDEKCAKCCLAKIKCSPEEIKCQLKPRCSCSIMRKPNISFFIWKYENMKIWNYGTSSALIFNIRSNKCREQFRNAIKSYIYIYLAWLYVCLWPINVEPAETIETKFFVGPQMTSKKFMNAHIYKKWSQKYFDYRKILWIREKKNYKFAKKF